MTIYINFSATSSSPPCYRQSPASVRDWQLAVLPRSRWRQLAEQSIQAANCHYPTAGTFVSSVSPLVTRINYGSLHVHHNHMDHFTYNRLQICCHELSYLDFEEGKRNTIIAFNLLTVFSVSVANPNFKSVYVGRQDVDKL